MVVEDTQDFQRDERKEELSTYHEQMTWEESCLFRFSKFLGMSLEGYEDEILELMNRISERRQNEVGKGVHRMTKFDKEMKRLSWTIKDKGKTTRGVDGKGTRALLLKYQ